MSMSAKYKGKCKVCKKEFTQGTTIFKINETYWCSDENCGKSKETLKPSESSKDAKTDELFNYVKSIHIKMWQLASDQVEIAVKTSKPGNAINKAILQQVFYKKMMDAAIHR